MPDQTPDRAADKDSIRVPIKIPADIWVNGRIFASVRLDDISAKGLSFFIGSADTLPAAFELRYQLSPGSKTINVAVEAKNKEALLEGVRVGCVFHAMPPEDERVLSKYLEEYYQEVQAESKKADKTKRVSLRVPIKIGAEAYVNGLFLRNVCLIDISTNGLSFITETSQGISGFLELRFQLTQFSRILMIKLEVKNRAGSPEGVRIGCRFSEISAEDEFVIKEFVEAYRKRSQGDAQKDGIKSRRVFIRVPLQIPAGIFINERHHKDVHLVDVSSNGLAFFIDESESLPDHFEVAFRLGRFSKTIRVKAEVKNRISLAQGIRIGCVFDKIANEDEERLRAYICNFVAMSFPLRAVNTAAFLCAADASWRIAGYAVYSYYAATEFGRSSGLSSPHGPYGAVLTLYAAVAFGSFLFSAQVSGKNGKLYFLSSVALLAGASIFILAKNISYWMFGLSHAEYFWVKAFLFIQSCLALYALFSLATGIASVKKINLILDVIDQHQVRKSAKK